MLRCISMEKLPIYNEFVDNNQEKFAALIISAEQLLLDPENRLTITTNGSLDLSLSGDVPEGPRVNRLLNLVGEEITDEIRQEIIDLDREVQIDVANMSLCNSVAEVALRMIAMGPKMEANVNANVWPPFNFESINHYEKTNSNGLTINVTEIKDIQDVGDATDLKIEVEDGLISKSLHLLTIDGQTINAITEINPTNDEQLITWFNNMNDHANEITAILMLGFRKPIDELEPMINDLSVRLIEEDYDPDYVTMFKNEMYDRILAMKAQIEMQQLTDTTTPDLENLAYFENILLHA
jgi:hypothetical protein